MNSLSQDIVKEWGLQGLSSEKQLDFVERIGKMMYQAILVKSLDILSEKEQIEFDLLLDEDTTTPQTVLDFLKSKIPTFELLVQDERYKLREDLLLPNPTPAL